MNAWGKFSPKPGSFTVTEADLPRPWHYLYTNSKMLLKVNQRGPVLAQVLPPCGALLFNLSRGNQDAPWQLFAETDQGVLSAFPMTFNATLRTGFSCTFQPDQAIYTITYGSVSIVTHIGISDRMPGIWMRSRIENHGKTPLRFCWVPAWRVLLASASMAAWDMPELYQSSWFFSDPVRAMYVEKRDPSGQAANRNACFMALSCRVAEAEPSYRHFAGYGGMAHPDALNHAMPKVARKVKLADVPPEKHNVGSECAGAFRSVPSTLAPGKSQAVSVSLVYAERLDAQSLLDAQNHAAQLLTATGQRHAAAALQKIFERCTGAVTCRLPNKKIERFLNCFLPWHLYWVERLDRGWMTGMRGTRDAAQDFSGISLYDLDAAENILLQILNCQKIDGSFLRQYSVAGPEGKHDARNYVDSGCWVLELLYDCIRRRGNRDVLKRKARYLEDQTPETVARHAERALDYYLAKQNRGEHGLILIREGDWNDSLNNAGLLGRGESVMVSCQVSWLLSVLPEVFPARKTEFAKERQTLIDNLRRHALNSEGYLNGVFTDGGDWLFSPQDPDGEHRISSAANAWGVIAGVFTDAELPRVFRHLKSLRGPCGYRLFYPAFGKKQIPYGGRLSTGDLAPGLGENGTVYNHGGQGFLLRAAAAANQCDLIEDVLLYALPFDERRHPVQTTLTEPYGVVNYYHENPDCFGEGGSPFISGTVSTLYRAFLEGVMGVEMHVDRLEIHPVLPEDWRFADCAFTWQGKRCELHVKRAADGKLSWSVTGAGKPAKKKQFKNTAVSQFLKK